MFPFLELMVSACVCLFPAFVGWCYVSHAGFLFRMNFSMQLRCPDAVRAASVGGVEPDRRLCHSATQELRDSLSAVFPPFCGLCEDPVHSIMKIKTASGHHASSASSVALPACACHHRVPRRLVASRGSVWSATRSLACGTPTDRGGISIHHARRLLPLYGRAHH